VPAAGAAAGTILATLLNLLQNAPTAGPKVKDGKVFFQPPWDKGGPSWIKLETYQHIQSQRRAGRRWDDRWGWVDDQEYAQRQHNLEISRRGFEADRARLREQIAAEQRKLRAKQAAEFARQRLIQSMRDRLDELEWQSARDMRQANWNSPAVLRGTAELTGREIFTGQTADGGVSFKAMGLRLLTSVLSSGQSEWVFNSADGMYRVHDKIEQGQSLSSAIFNSGFEMAAEEAFGRAVFFGGKKVLQFGAQLPIGGRNLTGEMVENMMTPKLAAKEVDVRRALSLSDPIERAKAIRKLYQEGGMSDLAELERLGRISGDEANLLNKAVTDETQQAVRSSMPDSIRSFEQDTTVDIEEVLIGDSGSSARLGGPRSVKTDADMTTMVRFNEQSLQRYANNHYGGDVEAAREQLSKSFIEYQNRNVAERLGHNGLQASDVDYKAYNGFGDGAGHSDVYPEGHVLTRQSTQGRTTVFRRNSSGDIVHHETSGQAMVDQYKLDKLEAPGGQDVSLDDVSISPQDAKQLIAKQIQAASDPNISAEKMAKALLRLDKGTSVLSENGVPPQLLDIAKRLRSSPQEMARVLGPEGQQEFLNQARDVFKAIAQTR
jgi:hypothetical protein